MVVLCYLMTLFLWCGFAIADALNTVDQRDLSKLLVDINEDIQLGSFAHGVTEKRVISFALYGNLKKYTFGAIKNVELAKMYYEGWVVRFYVGSDVEESVVDTLRSFGCEIFPVPEGVGDISGMFWRFSVAADESVDRFIVRDVDSRLTKRERFAVEEWIQSGKAVHIMRDHPYHCAPVLGGMWGAVAGALPNMMEEILSWNDRDRYTADMKFLEVVYWEKFILADHIAHDAFCCVLLDGVRTDIKRENRKGFPTQRNDKYEHVGQVFDQFDVKYDESIIQYSLVPYYCRRSPRWDKG